jgi:hypothetical protein
LPWQVTYKTHSLLGRHYNTKEVIEIVPAERLAKKKYVTQPSSVKEDKRSPSALFQGAGKGCPRFS